jgi:hypothetical protein
MNPPEATASSGGANATFDVSVRSPAWDAIGVSAGQAQPSLRAPDVEAEAHFLRLHASLDVGREYGAGTRLSHDADPIGDFTHDLLARLSQLDFRPPNLGPCVYLTDRREDGFHHVERMPADDGEIVGAGRELIVKIIGRGHFRPVRQSLCQDSGVEG